MSDQITLRLCASCTPETTGADTALRDALQRAGISGSVSIVAQNCFGACGSPVALSLQAQGRATYLFSGVDPNTDQDDIVATAQAYLSAPQGWIVDARACGRLRFCLVGRVPVLETATGP